MPSNLPAVLFSSSQFSVCLRLRQLALITCWTQKQASWFQVPSLRWSQVHAGCRRMLGPLAIPSQTVRPTTSSVCELCPSCPTGVLWPAGKHRAQLAGAGESGGDRRAPKARTLRHASHALRQNVLIAQAHDGAQSSTSERSSIRVLYEYTYENIMYESRGRNVKWSTDKVASCKPTGANHSTHDFMLIDYFMFTFAVLELIQQKPEVQRKDARSAGAQSLKVLNDFRVFSASITLDFETHREMAWMAAVQKFW